jgi:acylglycerol lipase
MRGSRRIKGEVAVGFLFRLLLAGVTTAMVAGVALRSRPPQHRRVQPARLGSDQVMTGDGVRLPLASWLPDGEPVGLVIGLHGYGDHRQAFGVAGPLLARHGMAVFAYDQRGFGETYGRGQWPGTDALIADLAEAVTLLREAHPDLPMVLLGESMGGSVALAGVLEGAVAGVDALILAAPGVRAADTPLRQLHDLALRLGALALPWVAVELRRGARPWLVAGESERLADDPSILRELRVGTYDGLIELADRASEPPRQSIPPTLILFGELDGTVRREAIDELARRLGEPATLRRYADRHHLLLHEEGIETLVADCVAWLEALPERPRAEASAPEEVVVAPPAEGSTATSP